MILEFLSSARLVPLPESMELSGLPPGARKVLVVLLPYGRALVGDVFCGYERWRFGKLEHFPWDEISLYDDSSKKLSVEGLSPIVLPTSIVTRLRRLLLAEALPPGDHQRTLSMLMPLLAGEGRQLPASTAGSPFEELLAGDGLLQRAYWGLRFALFRNDEESVEKLSFWLRRARRSFDDAQGLPLFWASPCDNPGRHAFEMLGSLGFSDEQITDFRSPDNPSIHRSQWGVLLKQRCPFPSGKDGVERRFWAFFSVPLWENLRRRDGLTVREALVAAQGYWEAREGEIFFRHFRSPWSDWSLTAAIGPERYESV